MKTKHASRDLGRQGAAVVVMIIMMVVMAGAAYALLQTTLASHKEQRQERESMCAQFVSQAGISDGMYDLQSGHTGVRGTVQAPIIWGKANYYVTRTDLSSDIISHRRWRGGSDSATSSSAGTPLTAVMTT